MKLFRKVFGKRGDMGIAEITGLVIAVLILIVLLYWGLGKMLGGEGGSLLSSVKNIFRTGRT